MRVMEFGKENPKTVMLLHGGGLSWWNYREIARDLEGEYHVILSVLDGHADSGATFLSIEDNATRLIDYIDAHFLGQVHTLGGLSLGGQVAAEMLSQRPDICRFALLESVSVKPSKLTATMIRPTFGMSYGLIQKRWFAKWQAAYLGIPKHLFEDYYRDTCKIQKADMIAFLEASTSYAIKPIHTTAKVKIVAGSREQKSIRDSVSLLHQTIPNSHLEYLPNYRHGDLSINHPKQYADMIRSLDK